MPLLIYALVDWTNKQDNMEANNLGQLRFNFDCDGLCILYELLFITG